MAQRLSVALILALTLIFGVWLGRRTSGEVRPEEGRVLAPSPNVLVAVRDLARLEGSSSTIERVIDLKDKQSRFFGTVQVEDAILLVASGEVIAGVDLSAIAEKNVEVDRARKRARLRLPRATVFSSRLDSGRTYVHTRRTDSLARRQESLESEARREAERTLEAAARERGILERAERSVGKTLDGLLRSLGFENIEIVFDDGVMPRSDQPHPIVVP